MERSKEILTEQERLCDLVDALAIEMKVKLTEKMLEGWGGWDCMDVDVIKQRIHKHVLKGDAVDIANLAAFLWFNSNAGVERAGK